MRNFQLLSEALAYIELHLEDHAPQEEIASACYCSASALQKLFRYALHMGVQEYATRRRLTQAAKALQAEGATVTEVAFRYGYRSPEVFSRAFRRLWGVTPTKYLRSWRFSGLFPRVETVKEEGGGIMRRKLDISELYETIRANAGCYVLCFDIVDLIGINEISRAAGDLAIRECLRRIDEVAAEEDMIAFRIGGDEFALLTDEAEAREAEAIAQRVLAHNGEPISFENRDIPLSMRAGGLRIAPGNLRYAELYDRLNGVVSREGAYEEVSFTEG